MVAISIINIQRENFSEMKSLFEKLFIETQILDEKKNWINFTQEERVGQDLRSIMFDVELNILPQIIQTLLKNRVQFCNKSQEQQIEIGVNTDTLSLLNIKSEDKEVVQSSLKGFKVLSEPESNDLTMKFDTSLLQAQALEVLLNFVQVEDYSLQQVFILDLNSTADEFELEQSLTRIQSSLNSSEEKAPVSNNFNIKINGKRKASDKQTEEISKLYENAPQKKEGKFFNFQEVLQFILLVITVSMFTCVANGKRMFYP